MGVPTRSRLIPIESIGEVQFERSRRAKRINITVRPFKGVRVAIPYGVSLQSAIGFIKKNRRWVAKQLEKSARAEKVHARIGHLFEGIDRHQAKKILTQRLEALARKHGYRYNRLFIRNQKARWGSCSTKNNISLNIKLTRLPEALRDYVIIHELVHTKIKNHGKRFYSELDRLVSDRPDMDRMLKSYGVGLLPHS